MAVKKVVAQEAKGTRVTIEFRGETYSFEGDPNKVPFEALEAFEEQKPIAFIKAMLGKDFNRLKSTVKVAADFNEFMDAVLGAVGVDPKDLEH